MVSLYKDPNGEHVFDAMTFTNGTQDTVTNISALKSDDGSTKIYQLESKVTALEKILKEYQVHLHLTIVGLGNIRYNYRRIN